MFSLKFLASAINIFPFIAIISFSLHISVKKERLPAGRYAVVGLASLALTILCVVEYSKYGVLMGI